MSIFETLSKINVNQFTEKKNNLTYLPWAYAWGTLKGLYPASFYAVAENNDGWNYFTDGRTCWVKCCVTAVDGDDHQTAVEYLPVMDYRNNAIPVDQVTSTAVNKAIQRCLTKAIARLGLGLYIYAGEDHSWGKVEFEVNPVEDCMSTKLDLVTPFSYDIEPDDIDVSDTVTVVWEIG